MSNRPIDWFIENYDGMLLALIGTFSAATATAMLRGARGLTILVGLVGWSVGCGVAPTVFTRVADHYAWIQKKIVTAAPTP